MLGHTANLFAEEGHTPDDLFRASKALARSGKPPTYRSEHLAALRKTLTLERETAAKVLRKQEFDFRRREGEQATTCRLCGNSGFCPVPTYRPGSLPYVVNGTWAPPHMTSVVLCRCPVGQSLGNSGHPSMTLDDYEGLVPEWRTLMEQRVRQRESRQAAFGEAQRLDRSLGQVQRGPVPLGPVIDTITRRLTDGKESD